MRDKRRLRLAERQMMLARIARREAMGALAGALNDEAKSGTLAERSAAMAQDYGARRNTIRSADELRALSVMSSGLVQLAEDATETRNDARRQAQWQAETLASTETRIERLEQRADEARRAIRDRSEERHTSHARALARKLHTADLHK